MSALVALTAQNTKAVTAIHELPPEFVVAQLRDAGLLRHRSRRGEDGDALLAPPDRDGRRLSLGPPGSPRRRPGHGRELGRRSCSRTTPSKPSSGGCSLWRRWSPRTFPRPWPSPASPARAATSPRSCTLSARPPSSSPGGHGDQPVDHLFDGTSHIEIPVVRHSVAATHGAGCTHSATLAAHLARGEPLEAAARAAAAAASAAVAHGLPELGSGDGPVDIFNLKGAA